MRIASTSFATAVLAVAVSSAGASAAEVAPDPAPLESAHVDSTICYPEEAGVVLCQSVTGTYHLTMTPSGYTIITAHLTQQDQFTAGGTTTTSTLYIDDQYVYGPGETVVVVNDREQQLEVDGTVVRCTSSGRLVFAGGELRVEPVPADCT